MQTLIQAWNSYGIDEGEYGVPTATITTKIRMITMKTLVKIILMIVTTTLTTSGVFF